VLWLQKTVRRPVILEGRGLHTGLPSRLTFRPAPVNTGLVFLVRGEAGEMRIPALVENLAPATERVRNTMLVSGEVRVYTVEHVLAALYGLGITNCYLDLEGSEPPEPEGGSVLPIVELLVEAGAEDQGLPAPFYRVGAPIRWADGEVEITAEPADGLRLSFEIDYPETLIGTEVASFAITPDVFRREIAPARTFVMREDVARLRASGLAQGGSLGNALVVQGHQLAEGQQLRFPDEFVRHKMLDLLGDVALLGMPIQGHIFARRSGHQANVAFAELLARRERRQPRVYPPRQPRHWDIASIMAIMPHRYPFLLVDRILHLEPGKRVVGIKNVSLNEPFFQGHFPRHPIMPAVLIIEAMAQTGGVLLLSSVDEPAGKLVYFSGIDEARFRQPVTPGDQLRFELEMVKLRLPVCKMTGVAYVGEEKVAEAGLMSTVVER
jgi:UDP-3-O-[3-hydroxymyristoyl] N-acetylglucosamine deacetylase/3-hydroxyacyl-[acyl-carrier-protein] dehydratase